jgi:hypothetical protein
VKETRRTEALALAKFFNFGPDAQDTKPWIRVSRIWGLEGEECAEYSRWLWDVDYRELADEGVNISNEGAGRSSYQRILITVNIVSIIQAVYTRERWYPHTGRERERKREKYQIATNLRETRRIVLLYRENSETANCRIQSHKLDM